MARPSLQSYLLRLWREQAEGPLRATLLAELARSAMAVAQPAEQRNFATLDALRAFLCAQTDGRAEPSVVAPSDCTPTEAN